MSSPRKFKIGDKNGEWEIIDFVLGEKRPYICKCSCGVIIHKNTQAFIKNRSCKDCRKKFERKPSPKIKHKVGDKVNGVEIIDLDRSSSRLRYVVNCQCGEKIFLESGRLNSENTCLTCSKRKRSKKHLGTIVNNYKILDVSYKSNKRRFECECLICKQIVFRDLNNIKNGKTCDNCRGGYYPGKIIDGMTLIERLGNCQWKIKCICGKFFQSQLGSKYKGRLRSCGCRKRKERIEKAEEKIGLKYKYLKIINVSRHNGRSVFFNLKCVCGNIIERPNGNEFKSESCGCKWHSNPAKGENHMFSKFTDLDILSMRDLYNSGCYTMNDILEMFPCNEKYLKDILNNKRRIIKA